MHGFCSSPVVFENEVIINGDHDGDAWIAALARADGKTLWKIDRENKTRSYCTPIIRDLAGRTQMILSGSKCVASYDPRTGTGSSMGRPSSSSLPSSTTPSTT